MHERNRKGRMQGTNSYLEVDNLVVAASLLSPASGAAEELLQHLPGLRELV